jgi:hypothetical protein
MLGLDVLLLGIRVPHRELLLIADSRGLVKQAPVGVREDQLAPVLSCLDMSTARRNFTPWCVTTRMFSSGWSLMLSQPSETMTAPLRLTPSMKGPIRASMELHASSSSGPRSRLGPGGA